MKRRSIDYSAGNGKIYKEARQVAALAHGHQTYAGIFPYTKHLDDVVNVLTRYGFSGEYIVAGYLHDAIEDGGLSYAKIRDYFGEEVAEMVYCVTDELGRNRRERKEKTLAKTASNRKAVVLKLADRIANIEHGGKIDMYRKEYHEFRSALYYENSATEIMWEDLDNLLGMGDL
jgi:Guanosine polyphosphate pyrophosphohydrolases/synthetases